MRSPTSAPRPSCGLGEASRYVRRELGHDLVGFLANYCLAELPQLSEDGCVRVDRDVCLAIVTRRELHRCLGADVARDLPIGRLDVHASLPVLAVLPHERHTALELEADRSDLDADYAAVDVGRDLGHLLHARH